MSTIGVTRRQRVLYEARELWRKGFLTYDSETTGREWEDQLVQWAVCDQEGKVLGSGDVKPTVPISEEAFLIHGISEEQLARAPTFAEVWPTLRDLLVGQTVVIYNASFDLGKLCSSAEPYGIEIPFDQIHAVCAMELFARFYGEVHEYYGTSTWQKLLTAIDSLEIEVPGQAHNAEHDAAATALIVKRLAELAEQELPPDWHPPVLVPCAGCGLFTQECAEATDSWYCRSCGVEHGLFHRCPGCDSVVETPATGSPCDDLCHYCQQRLHQEKMVLTGTWHWCPDHWYPHSVETPDLEELCEHCKRQREWKRQAEEAERARKARSEHERKERRRASAREYRQHRKEREQENRRRATVGLPPLEAPSKPAAETLFKHRGHHFQHQKDDGGRPEVYCLRCEAVWSKPPRCYCAGIKTYRCWQAVPPHLKTQTQLRKLKLKPAKGQKAAAVIDGAFDRYSLYNQTMCVPVERKQRSKKSKQLVCMTREQESTS